MQFAFISIFDFYFQVVFSPWLELAWLFSLLSESFIFRFLIVSGGLDLVLTFCMKSQFWSTSQMIALSRHDMMKRVPIIQRKCMNTVFVYKLSSKYKLSLYENKRFQFTVRWTRSTRSLLFMMSYDFLLFD